MIYIIKTRSSKYVNVHFGTVPTSYSWNSFAGTCTWFTELSTVRRVLEDPLFKEFCSEDCIVQKVTITTEDVPMDVVMTSEIRHVG
jgi:hypothetical protein